jgi:hypothetical protein
MLKQEFWVQKTYWLERRFLERVERVFKRGELGKFIRLKLEEEVNRRELELERKLG